MAPTKRFLACVLTACSLAALAACSSPSASPAPAVTVTATETERAVAPAPAPDVYSDDEQYLDLLYGSSSWFYDIDETLLIDLGGSICGALDSGATLEQIAVAALDSGIPMERAAELVAASVVVYCPWNESRVRA